MFAIVNAVDTRWLILCPNTWVLSLHSLTVFFFFLLSFLCGKSGSVSPRSAAVGCSGVEVQTSWGTSLAPPVPDERADGDLTDVCENPITPPSSPVAPHCRGLLGDITGPHCAALPIPSSIRTAECCCCCCCWLGWSCPRLGASGACWEVVGLEMAPGSVGVVRLELPEMQFQNH